jgi:hypothetical protein
MFVVMGNRSRSFFGSQEVLMELLKQKCKFLRTQIARRAEQVIAWCAGALIVVSGVLLAAAKTRYIERLFPPLSNYAEVVALVGLLAALLIWWYFDRKHVVALGGNSKK